MKPDPAGFEKPAGSVYSRKKYGSGNGNADTLLIHGRSAVLRDLNRQGMQDTTIHHYSGRWNPALHSR